MCTPIKKLALQVQSERQFLVNVDFFKELRRDAYVKCMNHFINGDSVAGILGSVDEAFLRGFGLIPIPILSTDGYIFEFGGKEFACDAINSTAIYMQTDKCPLIFSSKFIVYENYCPLLIESLKGINKKDFILFSELNQYLKVRGYNFSDNLYEKSKEILDYIDKKINFLSKTNINSRLLSYAKFYSAYETDLEKRKEIIDELAEDYEFEDKKREIFYTLCPYGILDGIKGEDYDVVIGENQEYAPMGCALKHKNNISYEV